MASLERILNEARRLNESDLQMLHREISRLCAPLYRKVYPGHWETGMAASKAKREAGYAAYREQRERDESAATS